MKFKWHTPKEKLPPVADGWRLLSDDVLVKLWSGEYGEAYYHHGKRVWYSAENNKPAEEPLEWVEGVRELPEYESRADILTEFLKRVKENKLRREGLTFRCVDFDTLDRVAREMLNAPVVAKHQINTRGAKSARENGEIR